jgi:hypothetical protein
MTTLPKKYEQELKDHRDSQNKDRLYQATKADSNKPIELPVAFEVQELKMKHDNWLLDDKHDKDIKEIFEKIASNAGKWTEEQFKTEIDKALKKLLRNK